ncbi:hypothetical protein KKC88_02240 [Patescibacteria group bacterium]|nr:hypothetical protein [Patescibacteria group bacterium]MBU1673127.1 hypothetical protein [Patescibacteria group bacterium]MBU1963805.1 hypothetical protein [Patescibacteria group bacterium]
MKLGKVSENGLFVYINPKSDMYGIVCQAGKHHNRFFREVQVKGPSPAVCWVGLEVALAPEGAKLGDKWLPKS